MRGKCALPRQSPAPTPSSCYFLALPFSSIPSPFLHHHRCHHVAADSHHHRTIAVIACNARVTRVKMESLSPKPVGTPVDPTSGLKRKRSPSVSSGTPSATQQPAAKTTRTSGTNQLSINYLARQSQEDLPLVNKDDTLPNLLSLLSSYSNILDRHESLASNLGARPLGPILIKRFERCFDAPPKVVASHHKGAASNPDDTTHNITWLEVIEFARSHPGQFTLSTFSEGRRVCQFYYPQKQLRVQISEEDFLFINSGRCQELIPPLPIWEDEEKEVGTCDVLEAKLKELTNAADMVAARTRQLGHRLKGRRAAILERRAEGGSGTPAKASALQTTTAPPSSAGSAFTSVNNANGKHNGDLEMTLTASPAVRSELLRHFEGLPQNQTQGRAQPRQSVASSSHLQDTLTSHSRLHENASSTHNDHTGRAASKSSSLSPPPPNLDYNSHGATTVATPAQQPRPMSSSAYGYSSSHFQPSKHNFSRPLPPALESSQPFRPLCQAHMDSLPRNTRVMPPCDRCRRLRMDCVKNLTSCAGCTKKHARCHWRDVSRDELASLDHMMDAAYPSGGSGYDHAAPYGDDGGDYAYGNGGADSDDEDDDSNPLEDLEALGEQHAEELQEAEMDEEGLRNARELARKGWEDGVKSSQAAASLGEAPAVNGDALPASVPAAIAEPTTEAREDAVASDVVKADSALPPSTALEARGRSELPPEEQLPLPTDNHALDEPIQPEPVEATESTTMHATPAHGGFHAVNA